MFKAVIAGYSRSPFTTARKGELINVKPVNLLAEVINKLVSKTKVNKKPSKAASADKPKASSKPSKASKPNKQSKPKK